MPRGGWRLPEKNWQDKSSLLMKRALNEKMTIDKADWPDAVTKEMIAEYTKCFQAAATATV